MTSTKQVCDKRTLIDKESFYFSLFSFALFPQTPVANRHLYLGIPTSQIWKSHIAVCTGSSHVTKTKSPQKREILFTCFVWMMTSGVKVRVLQQISCCLTELSAIVSLIKKLILTAVIGDSQLKSGHIVVEDQTLYCSLFEVTLFGDIIDTFPLLNLFPLFSQIKKLLFIQISFVVHEKCYIF